MDVITNLIAKGNSFLWSFLLIVLLCGTRIYYTIRLGFIQVRKLSEGRKLVSGHLNLNDEKYEKGEVTPSQSIAIAVAAQVGTGNPTGAVAALLGGGPGAVFWIRVNALLGMSTVRAEAILAQNFKTGVNGEATGDPVYYIRAAFRGTLGKVLAGLFVIFTVFTLGFMGNMTQASSTGAAFTEVFEAFNITISPVVIGVIATAVVTFVFLGGTQRLASVVKKIVPIMTSVYIVGSLILIIMSIVNLPAAIRMTFVGAFDPQAVLGANASIVVKETICSGATRGLFSNEANMGSTPHAHVRATAEDLHKQGPHAMISVFINAFVILNLTVFSVLTIGTPESGKNGTVLTQAAFMRGFGTFGIVFVTTRLLFFTLSTTLNWHFFGLVNTKYLFGDGATGVYSLLVVVYIIIGSALGLELVWDLADFFSGLMVIFNAMALLVLNGLVVKICSKYSDKQHVMYKK